MIRNNRAAARIPLDWSSVVVRAALPRWIGVARPEIRRRRHLAPRLAREPANADRISTDQASGSRARLGQIPVARMPADRDADAAARGNRAARAIRGGVHRPDHPAAAVRPVARRSHAADRPAGGHGPADRRHPARAQRARRAVAGPAALAVSGEPRTEGDDRCGIAARHPDAAAADRHGDRSVAGAPLAPGRVQRFDGRASRCRSPAASCSASCARTPCCPTRRAPGHDTVSRHRAGDLVGQDRRDGGPRDRISCAARSAR